MSSNLLLYIDPGSAMIIIQLIISIFAGIAVFFKKIRKKLYDFFKGFKND